MKTKSVKPFMPHQTFRGISTLEAITEKVREINPDWDDSAVEKEAKLVFSRKTRLRKLRNKTDELDAISRDILHLSIDSLLRLQNVILQQLQDAIKREENELLKKQESLNKIKLVLSP